MIRLGHGDTPYVEFALGQRNCEFRLGHGKLSSLQSGEEENLDEGFCHRYDR